MIFLAFLKRKVRALKSTVIKLLLSNTFLRCCLSTLSWQRDVENKEDEDYDFGCCGGRQEKIADDEDQEISKRGSYPIIGGIWNLPSFLSPSRTEMWCTRTKCIIIQTNKQIEELLVTGLAVETVIEWGLYDVLRLWFCGAKHEANFQRVADWTLPWRR